LPLGLLSSRKAAAANLGGARFDLVKKGGGREEVSSEGERTATGTQASRAEQEAKLGGVGEREGNRGMEMRLEGGLEEGGRKAAG